MWFVEGGIKTYLMVVRPLVSGGQCACSSFWISLTTDLYLAPVAEDFMLIVATVVARIVVVVVAVVVVVIVVVPTIVARASVRVACVTNVPPVCAAIHSANTIYFQPPIIDCTMWGDRLVSVCLSKT